MPRQWAADEYIWRQLANDLSARIAEGTYPLGSALPTGDELASEYALAQHDRAPGAGRAAQAKADQEPPWTKKPGCHARAGGPAGLSQSLEAPGAAAI